MRTTNYNMGLGKVTINFADGCELIIDGARVTILMNSENLYDDTTVTLKAGSFALKTPHQAIKWSKEEGVAYKHWTDKL